MGGGKKRRRGPRALSPTVRLERRTLWTMNAVPGTSVYGESLRRFSGQEHRRWDPTAQNWVRECFAPRPIGNDFSPLMARPCCTSAQVTGHR